MINILVSYARADGAEAAAKLRSELARYNIDVWRDVEDMRAGDDWQEQLRRALREVDAVLVLLTPAAVKSRYVLRELESAKTLEKAVVPILIKGCEMPEEFVGEHYRDLSRPETYPAELVSLLRDLDVTLWQKVQEDLSELQADEFKDFFPLLTELQVLLNARKYAPEIFKAFSYLIRQMHSDARDGATTLRRLLDRAIAGEYVQPIWPIHTIFSESNHIFKEFLSKFRERVPSDPATPIDVVLVVMNREEAEELASFQSLLDYLPAQQRAGWTTRYHHNPEEWRPFGGEGAPTIGQIVAQVLGGIGEPGVSFAPVFNDIRAVNSVENRRLLKRLRRAGCVVVIDSISVYHPVLQRALQQSALEMNLNTSVVSILPTDEFAKLVREMTNVFEFRIVDMEFAKRANDDDEAYGVCEQLTDEHKFRKWMRQRVTDMYGKKNASVSDQGIREFWYQKAGAQK